MRWLVTSLALLTAGCQTRVVTGIGMTLAETDERSSGLDTTIVEDYGDTRLEGHFKPSMLADQDVDGITLIFGGDVIATLPRARGVRIGVAHGRVVSLVAPELDANASLFPALLNDLIDRGWQVGAETTPIDEERFLADPKGHEWACPLANDGEYKRSVIQLVHLSEIRMHLALGCVYRAGRLARIAGSIRLEPDDFVKRGVQPPEYYQQPLAERKRVAVPRYVLDGKVVEEQGWIQP